MSTKTASFVFRLFSVFILLILIISAQGVISTHAAGLVVDSLADTKTVDGDCTLREAIENANNNAVTNTDCVAGSGADTITFNLSGTITLGSFLPSIADAAGLTLDGTGQAVTISGNNAVRVTTVQINASLTMNNLTIANGNTNTYGGGITNGGTLVITNSVFSGNSASSYGGGGIYNSGTLTITNSTFTGNSASWGGGIYNNSGTLTITNSTFSGNSAPGGRGGGIYTISTGMLTITNSTFSGNSASWGEGGGGIYNEVSTLTITNTIFSDNSAIGGLGGGIFNNFTLTIRLSTFSGNSAGSGGGIYNTSSTPLTIANSTFSGNSASSAGNNGGGIFNNDHGILTIINSTFSGNNVPGNGGGIGNASGTVTLRNTIVANSASGGNCYGTITNGGNNIDNGTTCGWGSASGSMSSTNPLLGTLTGSPAYFPLNTGSPAIDTGNDSICSALPVNNQSQNGITRPQGTQCDIGSYERVGTIAPIVTSITRVNPNPTNLASVNFTVTFSENVTGVDTVGPPFEDFTLTTSPGISGASITNVGGSGTTYTVTVNTGSGSGTIRLDVPDTATINDLAGNPLANLPFTSGESYTVRSVDVYIGGALQGSYFLTSGQSTRVNYAGVDSGPVKVESTNGVPIIVAIRDAWAVNGVTTSFSQLMGLPLEQLSNKYVFPGYNNVTLNEQLRIANVDTVQTTVTVTIGGVLRGTYTLYPPGSLLGASAVRINYPGLDSGPVIVEGTPNVKIISAIREAWAVNGVTTSFIQLMGLPAGQLSNKYVFPAYNNVTLNEQLRIANVDTVESIVTVRVGGVLKGTYTLYPPGSPLGASAVRVNYPGLDSGPLIVEGTPNVKIISSIRDAWAVNGVTTSFSQLMGMPAEQLSNKYLFPAYNNVTLNEQLRISNVDMVQTTVTVTIGGVLRGTYTLYPPGSPLGASAVRVNYDSLDSGPVVVEGTAGVDLISAIREAWAVNGVTKSFVQLMGLPAGQLSTTFLFPAYNNVTLNEQLRFGVP